MAVQPDFLDVFPEARDVPGGLTRKPRKGDRLVYKGAPLGVVTRVEGNLCWFTDAETGIVDPFIWYFPREGTMNCLISIEVANGR